MAFPQAPLDAVTELYIGGGWTDVTADVLLRDRIAITRGRADEAGQVDPSSCSLSLRNTNGKYSPRNPLSPYFGTFGRNTPMRVSVGRERDTFTRTRSSGWGSTDDGQAWGAFGAGGTLSGTDTSVNGTSGVHSVPAAAAWRATYLPGVSYRDVEVAVSVTLPATPTGGNFEPANILLRGQPDLSTYYMARLQITPAGELQLVLIAPGGAVIASTTVAGITYTGQTIRVRAGIEGGNAIRMRAWDVAGPEPRDWQVADTDPSTTPLTAPGWVAVRSGVAAGNTNTKPVVFTYDNLQVRLPRFVGEVSAWPPRWDTSGADVWVPIVAAGIGRRLGQGAAPLRSPLFREMTSEGNAPFLVAYWPCEDGDGATQVASASPAPPMQLPPGGVALAQSTAIPGSAPLPVLSAGGTLTGPVPSAPDGGVYVRTVMAFPPSGVLADGTILLRVLTTGTARQWDLKFTIFGGDSVLNVRAFDSQGTLLAEFNPGGVGFDVFDQRVKFELDLTQVGSDVAASLTQRSIGAGDLIVDSGGFDATFTGITVGHATRVIVAPDANAAQLAVGHVAVGTNVDFAAGQGPAMVGNAGETAGTRFTRLAAEEAVPAILVGDAAGTAAMGAQGTQTLLALLREGGDSDGGVLYETRGDLALAYRARRSVYNQPAALALDYTAPGDVAPPLEPVDDDQHLRNDVTVSRDGGSSARVALDVGPLSTQTPPAGVGRYDEQVTLSLAADDQLADQAAWRVHLGAWDEARYPTVHVDLAAGPHLIPAATALDIRDRLTISNPPAWLPPGAIDQLVEGYTETLGAYDWDLTYNCSPAGPWTVGIVEDTILGRADTAGSQLTSSITASSTSVSVTTTTGPVWINGATSPSFPFDIACGGEVMTVTAITGTSSPQTFTVTRGTNGVTLAHAAGTPLSLAHPMRAAL